MVCHEMESISYWKEVGTPLRPKDIWQNSYNPVSEPGQKAVFPDPPALLVIAITHSRGPV